ncbi:MAG: TonB-dependent receptor [Ignavibacteriaceae bacterium]|nr:TonB-dependent receptor [Ignavibacteriaceae bacterium]
MFKLKISVYVITLLFSLVTFSLSFAQGYSISGIVKDTLGVPIQNVNVVKKGTLLGTTTNQSGFFEFKNTKPGIYTLEFSLIGFQKLVYDSIKVQNNSVFLNVVLRETLIKAEQIIITAGRHEEKISELTMSAEVISSDFLSKKNLFNVENALRYVPGVNMTEDQISIRGSSGYSRGAGSRVLLLIDGIPFYTGDTGETIWEIIPTSQLERIEIIKGAASSLYGSTAIGGVVNVITKRISDHSLTSVSSFLGMYDKPHFDEWDWSDRMRFFNGLTVSHSNRFNDFGFSASLTRLEDDSYKQSGFSKKYITFLKADYDFSTTSSLSLFFNSLNKRGGSFLYWKDSKNALVPPDADQGQRTATNRYMSGLIYKNLLDQKFLLNVKTSYYLNKWNDESEAGNRATSNLIRSEVQMDYSFNDKSLLISGVEAMHADVRSNIFGDRNANGFGIYSHFEQKFSFPLIVNAGFRYDYNKLSSIKGSGAISPKVGLNYKLNPQLTFRTSFGLGFRAPTLAEAFTSTSTSGITVKPNPLISPEKNLSFEIGADWNFKEIIGAEINFFSNEFYDLIEAGIDPADGLVIFKNVTRARIQGFELSYNFSLLKSDLLFSANYTYLYSRDIDLKRALKYRPKHSIYSSIDWKLLNVDFGIDARYWSRVEEIDEELIDLGLVKDGKKRTEVIVFDLRVGYQLPFADFNSKILLNADNIFNYNYVELIGNLKPIRNFSLSIEFQF